METTPNTTPTILVILGGTGDLAWRKLMPAIYNLYLDKWIPDEFAILGVGHGKLTDAQFKKHLQEGVDKNSRRGKTKKSEWEDFSKCITFQIGEFNATSTYTAIEKLIKNLEKKWKVTATKIFYLAVPPNSFEEIAIKLGA